MQSTSLKVMLITDEDTLRNNLYSMEAKNSHLCLNQIWGKTLTLYF